MNPKQKISGMIVFTSVFVGSFLGAGITVITAPKEAAKGLGKKLKDTAEALKENFNDQLDHATVRLIESSTKVFAKTKSTLGGANTVYSVLKDGVDTLLKKNS
ncbi:secreted protein [Candidatus Magnetobacterium bavaricum]|uniref:Secreted protein n=1 Tax=Candidatus Magnetobacterium bavaricum TaxID=29290 RepID=A0A0F3GWR1_9BACT|nr:secreted protein [Candidatus Magnetobacterium bavaricum]